MTKKIVAIGGGESGRLKADGTRTPYETQNIDTEIVNLTGKQNPNFLLLAHAQPLEQQNNYFKCVEPNYSKLGCNCKLLTSDRLTDTEYVRRLLNWADIIYEGGGDTMTMIKLWQETGFDKELNSAYNSGKVMCGLSAGANCWFKFCSTDSLRILYGNDKPLTTMECLGFIDGLFIPHCDEKGRIDSIKEILQQKYNITGIAMSNGAAIEIVDNKYKIIIGDTSTRNLNPYGLKIYYHEDQYVEQKLTVSDEFKPISELYSI